MQLVMLSLLGVKVKWGLDDNPKNLFYFIGCTCMVSEVNLRVLTFKIYAITQIMVSDRELCSKKVLKEAFLLFLLLLLFDGVETFC